MKKHFILFFVFITILCSACQEYSYKETELHGIWQVQSVENMTTGEFVEVEGERYFIFQRHMVCVGYVTPNMPSDGVMTKYLSEFTLSDNTINMGAFRYTWDNGKKVSLQELQKFGIYDELTTFSIEHEKRNLLIFTSDKACITMRRY